MKDHNIAGTGLTRAEYLSAGFGFRGVSFCGEYNASRCIIRPFNIRFAQTRLDNRLKNSRQISFQSSQNGLCLRIAKPHVVFEYAWPVGRQHQAYEKNSAKRKTLVATALQTWLDDLSDDLIERSTVYQRSVGAWSHPAGV